MNARPALIPALGLSLVLGIGVAATPAAAQTGPSAHSASSSKVTVAKIGRPAPDFTLEDAKGKAYHLADYKGKIVVLQWINPDCPVCKRVTKGGLVAKMVKELKKIDKDIVHLAVNSTHYMEAPIGAKYLKEHRIAAPALVDRDGKVGHLYGAKTTPHVFVIDTKGVLRYSGAFDDDRSGKKVTEAMNYAVNAVRQIKNGETVAPDSMKSYGCSVKYDRRGKDKRGRGG